MRRLAVVLLVVLGVAGCSDADDSATEPPPPAEPPILEKAYDDCLDVLDEVLDRQDIDTHTADEWLVLGDGGQSLTVSSPTPGDIASVLSTGAMSCVLDETNAPDAVVSQVAQTSALMGRQEASWDDIEVSWSYHPDSGSSAVFTS